jgi:hypothetical protein
VPVTVGSLAGKADPAIVGAIQSLADAVNRLEPLLRQAAPIAGGTVDPVARAAAQLAQQQVQGLQKAVTDLQAAVAALQAGP